ncbi:unnamed protein product, partial [Brassica oleracea]
QRTKTINGEWIRSCESAYRNFAAWRDLPSCAEQLKCSELAIFENKLPDMLPGSNQSTTERIFLKTESGSKQFVIFIPLLRSDDDIEPIRSRVRGPPLADVALEGLRAQYGHFTRARPLVQLHVAGQHLWMTLGGLRRLLRRFTGRSFGASRSPTVVFNPQTTVRIFAGLSFKKLSSFEFTLCDWILILLNRVIVIGIESSESCFLGLKSQNYLRGAFKPACNISITFTDGKNRKQVPVKKDNGQMVMNPLFHSQETIAGKVCIEPYQGKKVEHNGVKVELLGQIEMYFDRGNFYDFTSLVRELDVPGEIYEKKAYPFEFPTVEMPYETYNGVNVRLRYLIMFVCGIISETILNFASFVFVIFRYVLKVTVTRGYAGSIVEYQDFVVRNYSPLPPINNSIKMEVGIEDCLHIEFEYNKSKYHLKDVILGKVYFLLVRIKIKNMDLEIRRRESTGAGANTHVETETLAKFELMDGAPVRGESIPVRLFLTPYDLTPTHKNINNKFSVKYYLNLVLVDEEDRRYFKQQEITLYRLKDESS